jgi:hypothetical protein
MVREFQAKGFNRATPLGGQRALHQEAEGGAGAQETHAEETELVGFLWVQPVEGLGNHLLIQERHAQQLREERAKGKRRSPPFGLFADPS